MRVLGSSESDGLNGLDGFENFHSFEVWVVLIVWKARGSMASKKRQELQTIPDLGPGIDLEEAGACKHRAGGIIP